MAKMSKKAFFATYGIEYRAKDQKILAPWGQWVRLPLTWGSKTHCFSWSTLAGTKKWEVTFNGEKTVMKGTCPMQCAHCYGCGCIRFSLTASEAEKQAGEEQEKRREERAEWINRVKADPVKRAERVRKLEEQKSRILVELETYDSEDPEDREDIEYYRRKLAEVKNRMEELA